MPYTRRRPLISGRPLVPTLALLTLLAIGIYALLGPTGILAWGDYQRQLGERQQELAILKENEGALQNRVDLLQPGHADPDLVSELVRRELNVARPDEIIVPLK